MLTLILTYRNRTLSIAEGCLKSLAEQSNTKFNVILVDYGSLNTYKEGLNKLVKDFDFVKLICCETTQQLWCKSRAINIALKQIETPYCFVGDIDMLYHPDFIKTIESIKEENIITYFQVGFLSELESKEQKGFNEYQITFKSQKEATGMTLYSTNLLKSINGYDEFYNGWGSEDTDVHVRLKNAEYKVVFFTNKVLMLHQWHPKNYRLKNDVTPFHSYLEQINASYLALAKSSKRVKANQNRDWGVYSSTDYKMLETINESYTITNKKGELSAFINAILLVKKETVLKLNVTVHNEYKSLKQNAKALLGKKTMAFTEMQDVNDALLECIISHLINKPYQYQFDTDANIINLTIKL